MNRNSFVTQFNRITFTARTIVRNGNLTVDEINRKWQNTTICDGSTIDRWVLNRDRSTILELFGIDIRYRRSECGAYCYYVHNKDNVHHDYVFQWSSDAISMLSLVNGCHKIRDRIFLEGFSHDPHLLELVIEAMKSNSRITIKYKRFTNMEAKVHIVEPFCIRDYQHRIYVVARITHHRKPCVFSLDRIESIEITDRHFNMPADFSPMEFFADAFGVMVPDNMEPELVKLRAYGDEMFYLASRPLHSSQQSLTKVALGEPYADFSLFVTPTLDFMGYMLSRADRIEVLSPAWLRERIMKSHVDSALRYRSDLVQKG